MAKIRGVIFDMDNCIFDTRTLGYSAIAPTIEATRDSHISNEAKEIIGSELWTSSLEDLITRLKISDDVAAILRKEHGKMEIPDMPIIKTYGDEQYIPFLDVKKILVTSGYLNLQQQKINKLNLAVLFNEIIIDKVDFPEKRKGKLKIFEEILDNYGWGREEVLVVGDNPHSELSAARALGIRCVQTLRPYVEKWDDADYHIFSLSELSGILESLNSR